jgi:hypothetical protein
MEDPDTLKQLIVESIYECTDGSLLDLIYKLLTSVAK